MNQCCLVSHFLGLIVSSLSNGSPLVFQDGYSCQQTAQGLLYALHVLCQCLVLNSTQIQLRDDPVEIALIEERL